ncbi:hypothetical protein BKA66DRAFT_573187 [Pyrenochaeta sp. MPI-SDFR-AT-0127]|nr:hypothetical protein BKA66DRAFT_573187 [Pyrenochaeta sp. MPI-SDFR-AT-0127]
MSRFEQLWPELRQQILGYLLISENVRQPPNHLLVEHYMFETNTLRLNHAINKEAAAVLYQKNTFIKVHNYFSIAEKSMLNHEVPFFKLKGKFEHHVADITIGSNPMNKRLPASMKLEKPATFLLLLADIPKYTRLLRLLDLANFMCYNVDFKLHQPAFATSPVSIIKQSELLFPFERVCGGALVQNVTFVGRFDTAIVERVKRAMTQRIAWVRAAAWEIHDIALSIKRMGDWAFSLNNADMTLAKYEDTRTFMDSAMNLNNMATSIDKEFTKALCRIDCITWVDTALLMLSDAALKESGERMYRAIPHMTVRVHAAERMANDNNHTVSVSVRARFYFLLGIAEIGLEHPIKAAKAFAKAHSMVANKPTKEGYELAKAWSKLDEQNRMVRFDALLKSMPKKPLAIPDMQGYITFEVDSEHWIMRKLGHQGPIPYEDKIKGTNSIDSNNDPRTAPVGDVRPEVLRPYLDQYREAMNHPVTRRRLICWVGLNASQMEGEAISGELDYLDSMNDTSLS